MYFLAKEVFNKKVALLASFLMSIFAVNLFYSFRILIELPSLTFFTFSAFFFYKYFKNNSKKSLYLGAALIAIGTLFKLPTATLLFCILIYLLITERLSFIKKKEIWIAALIFILILSPYIIWGYMQFGGFVITQAGGWNPAKEGEFLGNGYSNLVQYTKMMPRILTWPLLIFFILGFISVYKIFLGADILIKGKDLKLKRDLYLFLLFLIPIIVVSFSIGGIFEDRYILNAFPAAFIFAGVFILKAYNLIKKYKKFIAILFLIILLGSITYLQLQRADLLIKSKKDSYLQVKQAGLWLKDNSQPEDVIVTRSWPQIQVYSERQAIRLSSTKEEFESLIDSNPNITLLMVSIYEPHDEWCYVYPQENNLTAIQIYFADAQNTQPSLIIYKL